MRAKIQKISKYAPSIFQGRLDLAGKRQSISFTVEHPIERTLFRTCIASALLLACAYVFFVGATTFNVLARKEALAESAKLATSVSKLEREYFAFSQQVGPEDGSRLGLLPVAQTLYVHRPGNAAAAIVSANDL